MFLRGDKMKARQLEGKIAAELKKEMLGDFSLDGCVMR